MELLRYWLHSLLQPEMRELGFPAGGLGIERRYRNYGKLDWAPHLEKCKELQSQLPDGKSLSVLGAGRLYDVNLQALASKFPLIRLIDADPLCLAKWKRETRNLPSSFEFKIVEVTGLILNWKRAFYKFLSEENVSLEKSLSYLETLQNNSFETSATEDIFNSECLISLNLLSQIPLAWQVQVEKILIKFYGKKAVSEAEDEWLLALQASANYLTKKHLSDLQTSGAKNILLITDTEYVHYKSDSPTPSLEPISWDNHWIADDSITKREHIPALFGLDIEDENLLKYLKGYELKANNSWSWNIVPLNKDLKGQGETNRISSYWLRKSS